MIHSETRRPSNIGSNPSLHFPGLASQPEPAKELPGCARCSRGAEPKVRWRCDAALIDVYFRPPITQERIFQRVRSTDERDDVRVALAQSRWLSPFGMIFHHQEEADRRLEHEAPQIAIPARRQTPEDQPVASDL